MKDIKASDVWFGAAVYNTGMLAFSALEGDTRLMALNAGLIGLNTSLGVKGRKDEFKEMGNEVREIPEKSLGKIYESSIEETVREEVENSEPGTDYGSRRARTVRS